MCKIGKILIYVSIMHNNMKKIDLKDRKILYELDLNCRQSNAQIGKKVGLSRKVVEYRIKRMEEEGIITKHQKNYQQLASFLDEPVVDSDVTIIRGRILNTLEHFLVIRDPFSPARPILFLKTPADDINAIARLAAAQAVLLDK